ncbi:MAG: carboxymuconolactone decarboxylase family protein [Alphaproteobacteria bacterium]|jgi:4-carboxymuconolactone decarboxylase|tara:strand:+ start:2864 stop:3433 length:570 start_codon:yes stop_codon:yes gene_type:complete
MRVNELKKEDMNVEQRKIFDEISSGPRGGVRGPLAVWMQRPGLADKAQALGAYCRYNTSLSSKLSELAICIIARIWGSEYEWRVHSVIALEAGISEDIIESIRLGKKPNFRDDNQRIVYRLAVSLHKDRCISDELYTESVGILGQDSVIDLVGVLGYYTLISMTINVFEVVHPKSMPLQLQSLDEEIEL